MQYCGSQALKTLPWLERGTDHYQEIYCIDVSFDQLLWAHASKFTASIEKTVTYTFNAHCREVPLASMSCSGNTKLRRLYLL